MNPVLKQLADAVNALLGEAHSYELLAASTLDDFGINAAAGFQLLGTFTFQHNVKANLDELFDMTIGDIAKYVESGSEG